MGYLNTFGMGKDLRALLSLPWNVYVNHVPFGTTMNWIDFPNVLFLLLFTYPLLPRQRAVSILLLVSLARIGVWFVGSQQLRFLLPVAPALAVAAGYVVVQLSELQRNRRIPLHQFFPSLAVALLAVTLTYQLIMLRQFRSVQVVLGAESRALSHTDGQGLHRQSRREEQLPVGARVLQIGDGRSYYCRPSCIPDPDHFRWADEISRLPDSRALAKFANGLGATHVALSIEDLDFLLQHYQDGVIASTLEKLVRWREPKAACGRSSRMSGTACTRSAARRADRREP